MFEWIISLFSYKITIDVTPEYFLFKTKHSTQQFKTVIYLSNENKRPKVLEVGKEYIGPKEALKVELFRTDSNGFGNIDKMELFEAYLRHCIFQLHKRKALVRPAINISNINSFEGILLGYQKAIFYKALMNCGAHKVVFTNI